MFIANTNIKKQTHNYEDMHAPTKRILKEMTWLLCLFSSGPLTQGIVPTCRKQNHITIKYLFTCSHQALMNKKILKHMKKYRSKREGRERRSTVHHLLHFTCMNQRLEKERKRIITMRIAILQYCV